ncbi:MAG TPA: OmpH family outer membrane protein [Lacunisphaera sp.]
MKFFRLTVLSLLATGLVASLPAQTAKTTPAAPAATPAPAAAMPAAKPMDVARVAYINSGAFLEPATGIKQLVTVYKNLDVEFAPQQSELNLLQEKLRTLVAELKKLREATPQDAKAIEEKQNAGLALQQELQTKQQAAQQEFSKRQQELQGPVSAELGKEIHNFAQERNLTMIFDIAKLGDALLDAKPEADLTADFIGYFNAKHP